MRLGKYDVNTKTHSNHALCQFFVGMGVLTFLYCLVILPVYVFVYTIKLDFSKYVAIVVSDL